MNYQALDASMEASLPTRGAWIEIRIASAGIPSLTVAPHKGSVD